MFSLLDNPIYHALHSADQSKNIGTDEVCYFDIEIAPFIGMRHWEASNQNKLLEIAPAERTWFLLIKEPVEFIDQLQVSLHLPLYQCICTSIKTSYQKNSSINLVRLNESHVDEMIALTALTKPGPFRKRTIEFGNYHGIFEEGKLVAMGGERLHLDGLSEVSAICTHPSAQGKGYGAHIVHFLANDILERGLTPFLHSKTDNAAAMKVYRNIGFEVREEVEFYMFRNSEK